MSEVKRLNFTISQFESVVPYASEHGQYVRYTDYAKLAAEAQALREEVAKLRARVVPREVLERSIDRWACCAMSQTPGAEEAWEELRALLSEQEGGRQ